jgi:hypothetical protein
MTPPMIIPAKTGVADYTIDYGMVKLTVPAEGYTCELLYIVL